MLLYSSVISLFLQVGLTHHCDDNDLIQENVNPFKFFMFITPGAKRSETVNCIIHQPNGTYRFGFLFSTPIYRLHIIY